MDGRATLTVRARLARANNFTLDVDITFAPGVTVLFGSSGAGKSTLLDIVAGLVIPDAGLVTHGDVVLQDTATGQWVPAHTRRMAYVVQSLALFPHMTVAANVAYGVRARTRAERDARVRAALERFAAGHLAARSPDTLSGGEAQRVALARALATEPRAILLDEPFAALDEVLRQAFTADVRALGATLQVPIVHVTHRQSEARALGDRVVRVEGGRVVAAGGAEVLPTDEGD